MSLIKRAQHFLERTTKERPDIIVLGEYNGSNRKILVRGTECGHEWKTTPNNIRIGIGCPKCFNKRLSKTLTYSDDKFKDKLHTINPNYSTTDTYKKSTEYITFHCSLHDYNWTMRAGHIQADSCKMCKLEIKARQVRDQILAINKNIELLSDYVDYDTPMKWRCILDNHISESKPIILKNGNIVCDVCKKHQNMQQILSDISILAPNLLILDDFETIDDCVYVKLEDENTIWEDSLRNILKNAKKGKFIKK